MASGSRHSLAMVAESSYGVTPSTPVFTPIRTTGTTLALTKDGFQSQEIRSDRQISDFRHGARRVAGDISIELSYGTFDPILEAVLCGTWATNVLKAGTTRRSFTIERLFADIAGADSPYQRFKGCEFNTLALQVTANAIITATLGVIGQDMELATAAISGATYSAASTTRVLDSFTGTLSEGGSAIGNVTEVTLNLDNGLEPIFVIGDDKTIRPSIGRSNITGQVSMQFLNSAYLTKFLNETESSLSFTLPDGVGNSLTFTLPRIKYTGAQADVTSEGPITVPLPFQALVDETESTNLKIERAAA